MPMGYGEAEGSLGEAFGRLTDIWKTVGFTSVDDQPVKNPSDEEIIHLEDALKDATKALAAFKKSRG